MVGQVDTEFPPKRVKLIRALQGLSQDAFADKYDIGRNTVSRLEAEDASIQIRGKVLGALLKAAAEVGA